MDETSDGAVELPLDLVESARREGELQRRTPAEQIAHWAALGRALEAAPEFGGPAIHRPFDRAGTPAAHDDMSVTRFPGAQRTGGGWAGARGEEAATVGGSAIAGGAANDEIPWRMGSDPVAASLADALNGGPATDVILLVAGDEIIDDGSESDSVWWS
jgi:hypothetical protein